MFATASTKTEQQMEKVTESCAEKMESLWLSDIAVLLKSAPEQVLLPPQFLSMQLKLCVLLRNGKIQELLCYN